MRTRLALLLGVLAVVAAGSASASKCLPPDFDAQLKRADVVFVGTARSMDAELATTFDVERVYKGKLPTRVVVHTNAVKYAMLPPPWRYLVYAVLARDAAGELALFVETCGGSQRADSAGDDLARLGDGAPAGLPGSELASGSPDPGPRSPLSTSEDAGEAPDASAPLAAEAGATSTAVVPEPSGEGRAPAVSRTTEARPRPASTVPTDAGCAACALGRRSTSSDEHDGGGLVLAALVALLSRRGVRMPRPPRRRREPLPDDPTAPKSRSPVGRNPTRTRPS